MDNWNEAMSDEQKLHFIETCEMLEKLAADRFAVPDGGSDVGKMSGALIATAVGLARAHGSSLDWIQEHVRLAYVSADIAAEAMKVPT